MSDKTTEEAVGMSPKEALRIATINQGMLVSNGNKYYPEHVSLSAIAVFARSYTASLCTTIAQLREENERYRKCLEFVKHEAYASEPYLYSPDVLAFIEKTLTPKPPKTNG